MAAKRTGARKQARPLSTTSAATKRTLDTGTPHVAGNATTIVYVHGIGNKPHGRHSEMPMG